MDLKNKTGVFIGKGSKIINNKIISDGEAINGKMKIGKHVALGDGIKIITLNHDTPSKVF